MKAQEAAHFLYAIAALNILRGRVAMRMNIEFLLELGMGIGSLVFGSILATLGCFTHLRSWVASVLLIDLYISDSLLTL